MPEKLTYNYPDHKPARRDKTPEQALASLMRLASRAEKSSGDALRLMRGWGITGDDAEKILRKLTDDRFIDDRRYARAYAREKSGLSGWGIHKIRRMLLSKGIAATIADEALSEIDDGFMAEKLDTILRRKAASVKAPDDYQKKAKLVRYALSAGYGYEESMAAVEKIMKE